MSSTAAAEWPDWRGETAVILATGPTANAEPLEQVRGRARVIAIKASWRLAPWADVLYGCDRGWWIANQGVPEFKGLKVSASPSIANVYGARRVRLRSVERPLMDEPGTIACGLKHGGGHSGFQAMNLAMQFGARRLVLVGFDMTINGAAHWHDDYRGCSKPDHGRVRRWLDAMEGSAATFGELGVEVVNATPRSALKAFPVMLLRQAVC